MIEHRFTVLCHDVTVDRDSNNLTLSRVFTSVKVQHPKPPEDDHAIGLMASFHFFLVTAWGRADPAAGRAEFAYLKLVGPNGEDLLSMDYEVDLTASPVHHQRVEFTQMPMTDSGRYLFEVGRAELSAKGFLGYHTACHTVPLDVEINWVDGSAAEFGKVAPGLRTPGRPVG